MQAEERYAELTKLGVSARVVTIGKKGAKYFKRRTDRFKVVGARPLMPYPMPRLHSATRRMMTCKRCVPFTNVPNVIYSECMQDSA